MVQIAQKSTIHVSLFFLFLHQRVRYLYLRPFRIHHFYPCQPFSELMYMNGLFSGLNRKAFAREQIRATAHGFSAKRRASSDNCNLCPDHGGISARSPPYIIFEDVSLYIYVGLAATSCFVRSLCKELYLYIERDIHINVRVCCSLVLSLILSVSCPCFSCYSLLSSTVCVSASFLLPTSSMLLVFRHILFVLLNCSPAFY